MTDLENPSVSHDSLTAPCQTTSSGSPEFAHGCGFAIALVTNQFSEFLHLASAAVSDSVSSVSWLYRKGSLDRWQIEKLIPRLMKAKAARLKERLAAARRHA
jgi:hypothetical protein